jgi:hypothetical protein
MLEKFDCFSIATLRDVHNAASHELCIEISLLQAAPQQDIILLLPMQHAF